ncbi:MAG: CDP-archaeol synthase [Ruminococcaceae bacterium]|nr:CDP-archaeol synthase [Oscillospiraceae bacterium]
MLKRTLTGIVFIVIILPVYFFSDTIILPVAVSALSLIGTYEMLKCIGTEKIRRISLPAYALAVAMPQLVRLFSSRHSFLATYMMLMFAYLMLLLALGVFSHGQLDVEKIAASFMGVLYVVTAFICMILVRDRDFGIYIFFMAMFGPWGSDVAAYFTGRFLGRHKLIPDISPKKTVEGCIGGIIFDGIAAVTFGFIVSLIDSGITEVHYGALFVAGMIISVVSQVGDLIASYIKRKYNIKDYGNLLPGHGGILDRFDSVLCVMPVMVMLGEIPRVFDFFA